jgi:adenine-specific DNA-methyltransferase
LAKAAPSYQKLRGGYYTPQAIADFLAAWAVQSPNAHVLEPSCGDGVVLNAGLETLLSQGASKAEAARLVHGVEIDGEEAQKARQRLLNTAGYLDPSAVQNGDFFAYCNDHLNNKRFFDAIIGNPPFVRYQNFPEEQRKPAFELMHLAGMRPTKLTNAWVPFLVASSFLLKPHGRLAMVLPAEVLQVNYAAELRRFLSDFYNKLTLITFKRLVFEGLQQEVILLLGERNGGGRTGIRVMELTDIKDLVSYKHTDFSHNELKPLDHSKEKWTQYFLTKKEIELLRTLKAHPLLTRAGDVIDVDVGIVTGGNDFFVLNNEQIKNASIEPSQTQRIVARSAHLKGVLFTSKDWQLNAEKAFPSFLLDIPDVPYENLPVKLQDYVKTGEEAGFHTKYKCRIRPRWYVVPSVWAPAAFMLRQIHAYPKLILNTAGATSTDTIHRVRLINGVNGKVVTAAFLNSLTFAFAEVIGRSYGGGVLELEPNEAENIPLPLAGAEDLDFMEIHNALLRDDIDSVLNMTDDVLLIKGLGLSARDVRSVRSIWEKLRDRRINRRRDAR